jgi:hypothetical protein
VGSRERSTPMNWQTIAIAAGLLYLALMSLDIHGT